MKMFTKLFPAVALAIAVGVAAIAASAPADANPRGITSLSGTDLGSTR